MTDALVRARRANARRAEERAWIDALIRDEADGDARKLMGRCREMTARMAEAFPYLTPRRGYVVDVIWGRRAHWWLVDDESGRIADPTAGQFPELVPLSYKEYVEGDPVRLGPCANCGCDIMGQPDDHRPTTCSEECDREFAASIVGGW